MHPQIKSNDINQGIEKMKNYSVVSVCETSQMFCSNGPFMI